MSDQGPKADETPIRALRVKLVKLHQLSARIRTNANLVSDKAGTDEAFLARSSTTEEIDRAIAQLENIEQGLASILTLQ
jgi:hypothetical protein